MKMMQRALFCCLLPLLLAFQSYTAFQVCPGNNGTICAQRSTLSPYQNRVTLICNPGPGWGETEFFRTSDRRLLTNDFPPEVTNGLVYMVLQLSPSSQPTTEGVYVCRSKADNNKMSSNNETLYAYPEAVANTPNEVRVLRGQSVTLQCPFNVGPRWSATSPLPFTWSATYGNRNLANYRSIILTLPNEIVPNVIPGNYSCTVNTPLRDTVSRSIALDVYVNLAIIDYHQTKTEAAILDSTSNTDNKFVCRVQFGSTLDRDSEPMVTWYLNGVPVSDLPGPFNRPSKPSIMPVDDLNKTATSTLTITGGRMQDTGVYECRFNWKGETASHNFTFTIFGTLTLSILTSSDDQTLYLNVSLQPSSLYQPWKLLVRFTDTSSSNTMTSIPLNGIDSSPSLYLLQRPSCSTCTVGVAVKMGDTTGSYSKEVTMPTNGLPPSSYDLRVLFTRYRVPSFLVVALIGLCIVISLVIFGVLVYRFGRKSSKRDAKADGGTDVNQNRQQRSVACDCDGGTDIYKEPLMVEYCWQAKYLEGGLSEVMSRKRIALEAIFANSDNEPWQMSALPLTASPHHLEESDIIQQEENSSYGILDTRPENNYAEPFAQQQYA